MSYLFSHVSPWGLLQKSQENLKKKSRKWKPAGAAAAKELAQPCTPKVFPRTCTQRSCWSFSKCFLVSLGFDGLFHGFPLCLIIQLRDSLSFFDGLFWWLLGFRMVLMVFFVLVLCWVGCNALVVGWLPPSETPLGNPERTKPPSIQKKKTSGTVCNAIGRPKRKPT